MQGCFRIGEQQGYAFGVMEVTFDISRLVELLDDVLIPQLRRHVSAEEAEKQIRTAAIDTLRNLLESSLPQTLKEVPMLIRRQHLSDEDMRPIVSNWEQRFRINRPHIDSITKPGVGRSKRDRVSQPAKEYFNAIYPAISDASRLQKRGGVLAECNPLLAEFPELLEELWKAEQGGAPPKEIAFKYLKRKFPETQSIGNRKLGLLLKQESEA